jgi:hypothetical protein
MNNTEEIEYWRDMFRRLRLPTTGTWLAVPDTEEGDPRPCYKWVHGETLRTLPIMLSPGETPEQMRDTFRAAIPTATLLLEGQNP